MLKILKDKNLMTESIFMGSLTVLCFCLSVFRLLYTDTKVFLFLNWNLFLAFIPWVLTTWVTIRPQFMKSKAGILFLLSIWLLFFPNAPYILTDLFHLRLRTAMPVWFDLVLILSFAWTGLMFGFLSLWHIEKMLMEFLKKGTITFISVCLLFLGSFGIYIGRFLRWNSWDIISDPLGLLYDIGHRIVNPLEHPRTWGVTILMGVFLNIIYLSLRFISNRNTLSNTLIS